ncbi:MULTISPECIES: neutral zinc metallopeptidase [unclassified Gilliamella]|uniref:KPN_02809 family neutral zinc metallopeptidase n=1 Tax=unclassified Gilliamella TaxID=2685620 RepID=UPI00226A653E|nr:MULTISPECIES: neutral zinc metallopeptidase [unclassified Gilliamella]MCX8597224.1 neutral zinc metallopeptidase [Gilliamella sp. B3493]MCX8598851.1 neutral zinc metallopeptidase [Gilliamella sp. B3486]MCX8660751.1 neutral zinc metallopeptidase [Gilliamella sp. B2772]MCX8689140.1 neutral zinc metallopeptidase [Gilliamella sp. B2973]MCX8704843.1 neutral zinc metallopeptidase [Gilliamella sp. B3127]
MRWRDQRESDNIEDRRSQSGSDIGTRIPIGGKGKIVLFVVVLVAGYYGVDLTGLLDSNVIDLDDSTSTSQIDNTQPNDADKFTSVILASTEDFWREQFQKLGKTYIPPKLVLYNGATQTMCGTGQAMMGPFYCNLDKTVYLDLSFYQEMKRRLGGGGDFAQGYVIAHEVGHHVQNLLGTFNKVEQLSQNQSTLIRNQLSVKLELQADCYAGLWGNGVKNILDAGDIEQALNTVQAIGDDRLQQNNGYIVPDSFTHGTSKQRYTWFKRGYDSGSMDQCNTFIQ